MVLGTSEADKEGTDRTAQAESKFSGLEKQIYTFDNGGTGRQVHPPGFHCLMKLPRCIINGERSPAHLLPVQGKDEEPRWFI